MSDNDTNKVVDLKKAKSDKARKNLASAKTIDASRIWKHYKTGHVTIGGAHLQPGEFELGKDGLPPGCPVTPLGRDDDTYYFLNVGGGISTLHADKCGKGRMTSLFAGATGFLTWAFPRFDRAGKHTPDNWANESAMALLFTAAHNKGAWNGAERVRGRGAWRADDGSLVLHLGDQVRALSKKGGAFNSGPGEHGRHVYVWRPALPAPADETDEIPPGDALFHDLMTWNWRRGETDARLMLGWMGAAMLGGWLSWRPNVFVTGDLSCGKSELLKFVKGVLGDFFIESQDATAAGLHQYLGYDSVACGVDEMEGEVGSKKTEAVIQLARRASSGGRIFRGGANHKGQDFIIQSCFLFSAIAPPSMRGQDLSRLTILEMTPIDKAGISPATNLQRLGLLGADYLARLTHWANEDGEDGRALEDLIVAFQSQLAAQGHKHRASQQFGTLLAFAWAACNDEMPETEAIRQTEDGEDVNDIALWCKPLEPGAMFETEAAIPTWRRAFNHLLGVQAEALKTKSAPSVGAILRGLRNHFNQLKDEDGDTLDIKGAKKSLERIGLALTTPTDPVTKKPIGMSWANVQLFVPRSHPELSKLYQTTDWAAHGGADGTWINVLRQMDTDLYLSRRAHVGAAKLHGMAIKLAPLFERYFDDEKEDGSNAG